MLTILNIGLKRSQNLTNETRPVEPREALDALARVGFAVRSAEVHTSDTEPTLVVYGDDAALAPEGIFSVSNMLDQDCIAVYYPGMKFGALYGPLSRLWGEFNPKYFLPRGVAKGK